MTRLGWTILALLIIAGGCFILLLRGTVPRPAGAPAVVASAGVGPLRVPVAGVAAAALTDTFTDPRGDGARTHGAIDIMAPQGTPVLAAQNGTVEKLFESRNGGHTIYIRSANGGWTTYYAHLDSYAAGLHEGQVVAAGAIVAAVGSTGDADAAAPHLHFEVHRMAPGEHWWQGTSVDPYPLLTGRGPPRP